MAELGIDVGRDLATSNDDIVDLHVTWVRTPITPHADVNAMRGRIESLRSDGVKVAMVIDSTAVGGMSFDEAANFYADAYGGLVGAFECGNEFDAGWQFGAEDNSAAARRAKRQREGGPGFEEASWILDPEVLTALLNAFRNRLGEEFELWSGGLVCGQPEFLDEPRLNLGAATRVAVHPYDKDAAGARGLLTRYANKLDSQPWGTRFHNADSMVVTEFGVPSAANDVPSEQFQAGEIVRVVNALVTHPRINAVMLFCYDNEQDRGGFGLKAGNRAKPAFELFQARAEALRPVTA